MAGCVDVIHDLLKPALGLLEAPAVAAGILLHFQRRGGDAAGIGGLARREKNARLLEQLHRLGGAGHVGAFGHGDHAVLDQHLGILAVQLVLGGAGQRDVAGHVPDGAAADILRAIPLQLDIFRDPAAPDLLDLLDKIQVDTLVIDDIAAGIRTGDDLSTQGLDLLDGIDRDIARPRDDAALALEIGALLRQHRAHEECRAEAGRLLPGARAAIDQTLAGQDAGLETVVQPLVHAEHIADLARADADIASRHIGILADMTVQFGHEGLAEAHDFAVGLALGVEIRPALAAADGQAGQGILEGLLEAQELDDPDIDRRMKADPALIGAKRRVELHPEAAIDLHLIPVVDPGDAEDDLALGLADALDQGLFGIFRLPRDHPPEAFEHLANRLVKFWFCCVPVKNGAENRLEFFVNGVHRCNPAGLNQGKVDQILFS